MTIELGELLGSYNGGQSFENISSWDVSSLVGGAFTAPFSHADVANIHSSAWAGELAVTSGDTGYIQYNYEATNDIVTRWSPDVTTHHLVTYGWGRVSKDFSSGDILASLADVATVAIPYTVSTSYMERWRLATDITSADDLTLKLHIQSGITSAFSGIFDDILTAVDVVSLQPDWDTEKLRVLRQEFHETISGRESYYSWGEHGQWRLPLTHVPNQAARFMNLWWRDARPLMFTFDSSETNDMFIVKITNKNAPFSRLSPPYEDLWQGNLELEAMHDSLNF